MNDTVITGAAIGFLVWAGLVAVNVATLKPHQKMLWAKTAIALPWCTGIGAAIGWLVS